MRYSNEVTNLRRKMCLIFMNNFYNAKHYGPKIVFIRQKILFDFGVKCEE